MAVKRSRNANIPLDLMVDILKKLPVKTIIRFLCVSKQWTSIIRSFIVKDSIVTRSFNQPSRDAHLILCSISYEFVYFFSYTYPYEKIFAIDSNMRRMKTDFEYLRGLIGCWSSDLGQFKIHNPTTNQSLSLPIGSLWISQSSYYMFGYDPVENQYKVLRIINLLGSAQVLTLGDPEHRWRFIECSIGIHTPKLPAVCINGAIYYNASTKNETILVSFDVRSEKFNNLEAPGKLMDQFSQCYSSLVNYQGKLGCMCWKEQSNDVDLWVMEDAKKQEWSKITLLSMLQGLAASSIKFSGVIQPGGEIVIVRKAYRHNQFPLEVYYYDPIQNCRRSVEIKSKMFKNFVKIWAVTDHVENTLWM